MPILAHRRRKSYTEIAMGVWGLWLVVLAAAVPAGALTNGLALTPPMGWNSVTDTGDGKDNDHADWAEARVVVEDQQPIE